MGKKIIQEEVSIFLLFSFIALVMFNKIFFLSLKLPFNANYIYPRTAFHSINWGSVLWNPYILCGSPLLADGNNYHILSPFNFLVFFLQYLFSISNFVSFHLVYILRFPLAGFFMYLYAKSIGINKVGAILSGLIYSYNNFFPSDITGIHRMDAMVWFGLILFLIEKAFAFSKINRCYLVLAGFFFGIQFLSGSIQYVYYFSLFLIFYLIFKCFIRSQVASSQSKETMNFISASFFIFFIAIGISSIQLFPTYELIQHTARFYLNSFNKAYGYYYLDSSYLKSILFLNPKKLDIYVGIIPVLLTLFPLFSGSRKRNKYYYFYLFIIAFVLIISSKHFITEFLYYHLPLFSCFQKHLRAFSIFFLSIAILAGFGLEKLRSNLIKVALIGILLFQLYPYWRTQFEDEYLKKLVEFDTDQKRYLRINSILNIHMDTASLYRVFLHPDYIYWPIYRFYSVFGRSDLILKRYLAFTKTSTNAIDGLRDKSYYAFLLYPNYLKLTNTKYIVLDKDLSEIDDEEEKKIIEALAGYLKNSSSFAKIYEDELISGYQFKDALPRALFVTQALYLKDRQGILDLLKQPSFDPKTTAVLEEPLDKFNLSGQEVTGDSVQITKYLPSRVEINLKTASSGLLILSDTYYPGWKAYIDNKPIRIHRANYLFRAVYVDKPGVYSIKFIYSPLSFKIGASITIITLIGCIGGMIWVKRRTH